MKVIKMSKRNVIRLLIFFGLLVVAGLSTISCQSQDEKLDFSTIPHQTIELRDSLFILFTCNEFMRNDFRSFNYLPRLYKINENEVHNEIGRIFYSANKLKFIAWIVEKYPNAEWKDSLINMTDHKKQRICNNSGDTVFSMSAVIGYRDIINSIWKIYPLEYQSVICTNRKEDLFSVFETFYFKNMKEFPEYIWVDDKNYGGDTVYNQSDNHVLLKSIGRDFINKKIGYNIQDPLFWEKSLIWQKSARIPGLYNFQTQGNITKDDKDAVMKLPEIIYPDSILKMYGK